ncbi:MAG: hypothetical protein AB8G23_04560 [Myxococcota bacterium]
MTDSSSSPRDPARNVQEFVQLLRQFLSAYTALSEVFAGYPETAVRFDSVRGLAGDDERSVLYRLKEKSHALFRTDEFSTASVRREALFDLAVGSLFHEVMKLRELLYQREVYAPRVDSLRRASDAESEALFVEFDRIFQRSETRSGEVISEVRILLAQSRDQVRELLVERASVGAVTRCLLSRREEVEAAFPEGFEGLLQAMHGNAATGLVQAARSLLESAYFVEAAKTLREAERNHGAKCLETDALLRYAEGMQAVLDEEYATCVAALESWIDLKGPRSEPAFSALAQAVLGRLGGLVEDSSAVELIPAKAKELILRLETETDPESA